MDRNLRANQSDAGRFRAELAQRYLSVRSRTEALTRPLSPEDCQIQSMPDASPAKWHLAHTTWFWETFLLAPHLGGYETPDPGYDFLFNSYYEAIGPRHVRHRRGMVTRPSLDEVYAYRAHVDEGMRSLFEDLGSDDFAGLAMIIEIGCAHEEQHQELILTDIKHALFQHPERPAAYPCGPVAAYAPRAKSWTRAAGGLVEIGQASGDFFFDNEGPRHKTWLEPYEIADGLITNGEVADFIEDGGYRTASLWLSAGWAAVQAEGWAHPMYWEREDGDWSLFTLHGVRPMDPMAPAAHLSFYEADALASWMGARLPTEAEWEHVASDRPVSPRAHKAGLSAHPLALDAGPLKGLYGEVWQWTSSAYGPYPGYQPPAGAIGEYNGKFMSGQQVLRGSSCATSPGHARATYRNFFHAPDRWQFSGVRLARDVD